MGQPLTGVVEVTVAVEGGVEADLVVGAGTVVVCSVVVRLVGRTGGAGVAELLVDEGGQFAEPHSRSVGQQPPPREAGHERYPVEHVRLLRADEVTVTVRVTVKISGGSVDALGDGLEVEVDVWVVVVEALEGLEAAGATVVNEVTVVVEGVGTFKRVAVEVCTQPTS